MPSLLQGPCPSVTALPALYLECGGQGESCSGLIPIFALSPVSLDDFFFNLLKPVKVCVLAPLSEQQVVLKDLFYLISG